MLYFRVKQVCGFSAEEEEEVSSYLADSSHTSLYMVRNDINNSPIGIISYSSYMQVCSSSDWLSTGRLRPQPVSLLCAAEGFIVLDESLSSGSVQHCGATAHYHPASLQ